jgi:hypothetical protein
MKLLMAPAVLLLLANTAIAEGPGMQENLQKILDGRYAELERSFNVRIGQVIESRDREAAIVLDGESREPLRVDYNLGDLPLYAAWHSAR